MITIRVPTPLRGLTNNQSEISATGTTVRALLDDVTSRYAGLRPQLLDTAGELRRFVNIFLNDEDIRSHSGLDTSVSEGDTVEILPAIAGGISASEWRMQLKKEIPEVKAIDVCGIGHDERPASAHRERDGESALHDENGGLDNNVRFVDVRTKEEWAQGHIPGALHIDRGYLELKVESLIPDKSKRVVCYCAGGVRSLFAAKALKTLGYERVESLTGGFDGWKEAGLPFVQPAMLTETQNRRYLRHLSIPEVGEEGQAKLLAAKVLLIGAGGLGCPAALYLAAAGVGTMGIVDDDVVDESNLQRQILHTTSRIGNKKTASAKVAIAALNPDVNVIEHHTRLTSKNVMEIFSSYDFIVDGSDNFPTRYLVNDASVYFKKPCVHGSIYRFEGQLTVFWPGKGPCYRCLYPEPPPPEFAPSCAEAGVLGVLPGVIGLLEAVEAIKIIIGRGKLLVGRLIRYDALAAEFRELKINADPKCLYCAPGVSFPGLVDYDLFCAAR